MAVLQTDLQKDWLLDSLEKYEGIYIFEMQYPTRCLEWNLDGSAVWLVSMAGNNSEVLQLALPERMLHVDCQTLWAKRDFKLINGAFIEAHITALKCIPATESVVTATSHAELQVWSSDTQTNGDLLHKDGGFTLPDVQGSSSVLLDVSHAHPTFVLCGSTSSLHSVQIFDLPSKQPVFHLAPPPDTVGGAPLHCMAFLNGGEGNLLVSVSGRGQEVELDIWDTRASAVQPVARATPTCPNTTPTTQSAADTTPPTISSVTPSTQPAADTTTPPSATPTTHLLYSLDSSSSAISLLAATGQLDLYDPRNLTSPQASCTFNRHTTTSGGWFGSSCEEPCSPCVKCGGSGSHLMSVSGVEKGVHVYNTSTWSCDTKDPPPLFVHPGHEMECDAARVLVHTWQPGVGGTTVLSADSQANLHAWQWTIT